MRIIDTEEKALNKKQALKLSTFLVELIATSSPRILYRRANEDILKEKLNLSDENYYDDLNTRLFMVGEKGRSYLSEYSRSISDLSQDTFSDIFIRIHKVLTKSKNPITNDFMGNYSYFSSFFIEKQNEEIFINKILNIVCLIDRQYIRDYYYMLLHRIGAFAIRNSSTYVSTTESSNIADIFTGSKNNRKNIGKDIKMILIPRRNKSLEKVLLQHKLPYCKGFIYPKQKEFSFKGAITPNRILGYIKLETEEFVVNPSFFTSHQTEIDMFVNGIDTDQSEFWTILRQTNYKRGGITDEEDYYEDLHKQ